MLSSAGQFILFAVWFDMEAGKDGVLAEYLRNIFTNFMEMIQLLVATLIRNRPVGKYKKIRVSVAVKDCQFPVVCRGLEV